MIKKIFLFILISFALVGLAFAQNKSQGDPKTTVLSFEDELIQGDVSSPDLFVILKNKNINFGRLLKLRKDFIPEMKQTREDVHGSSD